MRCFYFLFFLLNQMHNSKNMRAVLCFSNQIHSQQRNKINRFLCWLLFCFAYVLFVPIIIFCAYQTVSLIRDSRTLLCIPKHFSRVCLCRTNTYIHCLILFFYGLSHESTTLHTENENENSMCTVHTQIACPP